MKFRIRAAMTVMGVLAASAAVSVVAAGSAQATPPYEPSSYNLGQIHFYNAAGAEVTSGSTSDEPFAQYAVATSDDPQSSNTTATLYAYTPVANVDPANWTGEQLSATTTFPIVDPSAPSIVKTAGAHRPVLTGGTHDTTLANYALDIPNTNASGSGYEGLYQIRLRTAGNDPKYWAADIQISGSTWTLVYPTALPAQDASSLAISRSTTVRYGSSTTTSATLKDTKTGHVIPGAPVKLYSRTSTSAAWALAGSATTSSKGVASKAVKPTRRTYYQWRYAGSSTLKASTSATQTVSVSQVVSAHLNRSSVMHGKSVKVYGTVSPSSSGKKVTLQRLIGKAWRSLSSVVIKSQRLPNGKKAIGFVFSTKLTKKGSYSFRVYKPATPTLSAGYSSTLHAKAT